MMKCIDDTNDLNLCAAQTMEDFRDVMETGIEELDLPPLDPIYVEAINFRFFNLTIEILDVYMKGFRNFKLEKSNVDKDGRTWDVSLSLPRISTVGVYKMFGTIPPNLDLGLSTGDQRLSADKVFITAKIKLGPNGDRVQVTDLDLDLKLEDINLELECLFPRNGKCCPRKYLKSCNTILTKTVLRFINKDGRKFVEQFQPEISRNIRPILLNYFNKAIASAEARYLINV